jgi:RNA polymerase sigma-70 factor (ECF subfamily)
MPGSLPRDGTSLDQEALVARAQAGDRAALEALLSSIAPQVARFGRRLCGAASPDADDALQEALVSIATHLPGFEGRASFSSWVFALVRSACARRRRGAAARVAEPLDRAAEMVDAAPGPEASAERAELRRALEAALDGLTFEQREVLALRDIEGLSAQEAADALGVAVPALKSRLHRARKALRERLAPALALAAPAPSPTCPDVLAALSAKLEDDLAPDACAVLERHVVGCSACSAVCESLRAAVELCRTAGREGTCPPASTLRARVRAALAATTAASGEEPTRAAPKPA